MEKALRGGKELGLLELQQHAQKFGYSIPEFFVLPESGNEEEIAGISDHFNGKNVIVRSNSLMENAEFGFDGIYKTIVVENCNLSKLKEACKEVSDSLFSETAIAYRSKAGIAHDSIRVIVQKFIDQSETGSGKELKYFVMETSVNAQGDISIVTGSEYDFVNSGADYEEMLLDKDGETIMAPNKFLLFGTERVLTKLQQIAAGLNGVFGPVSLEGSCIRNKETRNVEIFLFQRRLLPKEIYHAQPETVPAKYADRDILFRSSTYRGAGKLENLPVIVMPGIDKVSVWENELRSRISQFKSDVILFVPSMALGVLSVKILNDYSVLTGVKAIISREKIDYSSHAFKVASLARIPFVSIGDFSRVETVSAGSLFFTENEAVFCIDEIRDEFNFVRIKKSAAASLATLLKRKGITVKFSEEERKLGFQLDLNHFSFDELKVSFHRLLEDVSGEVWLLTGNGVNIGFVCENSKGHVIRYSGWANYLHKEGHMRLDNFDERFENNRIEWNLIQKIAVQLDGA
ncbi:MAG: hypothetical protein JWM20_879 [Patescibacteria group bacterium]|nr:hypothetical protein [Patescibacteria group bacterium]